ncbi:hypothetical protein A1Q2_05146 [Trichosporon asahii var. asahii CBS 8904]|uniref:Major facilitator superfamily (MFS) profile domain-containing protein n=1 Tax=Trichosporon asahii var. asahii (strain CBS 8904) TaxID=1220162 RepID=K1VI34_TRIAC|nr:hypothetical protein A1Q2_05146 [Trichosporon asahii var. asahii CBS 8904]
MSADLDRKDVELDEGHIDDSDIDPVAERKLIRKLDLQGLLDILGDNADHKFSIVLMSFYITYIVFNVPGTLFSNVVPPNFALATGAMIWGIASTAQAGATNFAGMVVCRLFIGIGEAGFGAAVSLYYALWYRREEIATRISLYVGAGSLAGCFGGLIAYGVSFIHSHVDTWRILFLIEGLPTILLAIVIIVFLPSTPAKSWLLKPEERALVKRRLRDSGVSNAHGVDVPALKSAFRRVFSTRTTYLNGLVYLGLNLSLGSVSGFLPTILKSFGYTDSSAQLMTVPQYACAFVVTVGASYLSDRTRQRGIFVIILMLASLVGFTILIAVPGNNGARYFATFLVVSGAFSNIPLMLSWAANTAGSQTAAAIRLGFMNSCGQCFSILASFIFPKTEGPKWHKGFALNLAFNGVSALTAAYLSFYYASQNRKRDREEAARADEEPVDTLKTRQEVQPTDLHDLTPGFRYFT